MDVENCKKILQDAFDKEANRKRLILCCSCFNMSKKASQAFTLLHPDMVLPEIIKGRDRVYKFAEQTQNEHVKAISKLTGKYAYYIEMDGDKITREENLLTGARIA